jgi:hypothetical protein
MIARTFTELYLRHFNQLHGALCFCWQTAFCYTTKQLDKNKLKEKIRSFGIYNRENAIKDEESFILKEKPVFKTLTWVNDYTVEENNNNIFCEYIELYKQALKEVEDNLFELNKKSDKIAYANIILRDFNKSYHHNQTIKDSEQNNKCKEFFEFVLNRQFIAENDSISVDNEQNTALPNYDLSARLINHFHFIDKLIELFLCFDICLISLAEKANCNLYTFRDHKHEIVENPDFQINALHKFNSRLSDECLVKIMHYLSNKKLLENPNSDSWLFWFNRKPFKNPLPLKWRGTPTMLSNIIQHLCGECNSTTIKTAFGTRDYVKPTRKEYESGRTYKEIEQIITISKQKK